MLPLNYTPCPPNARAPGMALTVSTMCDFFHLPLSTTQPKIPNSGITGGMVSIQTVCLVQNEAASKERGSCQFSVHATKAAATVQATVK